MRAIAPSPPLYSSTDLYRSEVALSRYATALLSALMPYLVSSGR